MNINEEHYEKIMEDTVMMITEIEVALKEVEAWLQNGETWENELDGLESVAVGMAVVARIRKIFLSLRA